MIVLGVGGSLPAGRATL